MIDKAAEVLVNGQTFIVTTHLNPDGDAIGSMLAMVHLLRAQGKQALAFHSDPVPGPYRFLEGVDEITSDVNTPGPFDVLVVVDVGERERIPEILPTDAEKAKVLVIDHHKQHGDYGDIVWRRKASAVGEMIVELARHLSWDVTPECAECAFTAILTDTGSFRYSSTTAYSLEAASWLVSLGVQPWKVSSHVYETWPVKRLRLLGDVLGTLEIRCEGKYASLVITQKMLDARDATVDMTEGFVNEGRKIEGVEVSALFREKSSERYRLSFRSRGRIDVSAIAAQMGGGGHRNAAGASAEGKLKEVRDRVTKLVEQALSNVDPNDPNCWSRH